MNISDSIGRMNTGNEKQNLSNEYHMISAKYHRLKKLIDDAERTGTISTIKCPLSLYYMQLRSMADYIAVLEAMATIEGVDLSSWNE